MSVDHKTLTRQGYVLLKKKLSEKQLKQIRNELEVTPETSSEFAMDVESFKVYTEDEKTICIPRYYGVQNFGKPDKVIPMDTNKIDIKFNGTLRDNQLPVITQCLESIKKDGGGIISLPCGKHCHKQ